MAGGVVSHVAKVAWRWRRSGWRQQRGSSEIVISANISISGEKKRRKADINSISINSVAKAEISISETRKHKRKAGEKSAGGHGGGESEGRGVSQYGGVVAKAISSA